MITAREAAEYFLAKVDDEVGDGISNLKLQKLVYYAQGFHLAIHGEPLFAERIEAWEHGPVVPDLYHAFKQHGSGHIPPPPALDFDRYPGEVRELLDEVYDVFGQYSAWKLRNMTHEEQPWREAYADTAHGRVISRRSMQDYFAEFVTAD